MTNRYDVTAGTMLCGGREVSTSSCPDSGAYAAAPEHALRRAADDPGRPGLHG
ncbi:hypothetical protein ACGF13_34960 [Kitasatospora sp. NPDC048286]|uniref:hypothetical protein n=1 Tax=unclassified Kitasatospora TaxID=2633591 RepID=UPI0037177855